MVPRSVALRRPAQAEELGMTCRKYSLGVVERGKYL